MQLPSTHFVALTKIAGNLEAAINYHLENEDVQLIEDDLSNDADGAEIATAEVEYVEEDGVRAPIPAKREQLLMPEDDNFRVTTANRKRRPMLTVCPLRNFAREAELQEQQLLGIVPDENAATASSSSGPRISSRSIRMAHKARNEKRKRLEDLFRPPIDLLFGGTFQAARDFATQKNRWLVVNLQDQKEFKSQVLNRDIWSDMELKRVVLKHFVLWQVSVDNPEGLRFKTFYHCHDIPYVCIIDPRTGEEKHACTEKETASVFRNELVDYLVKNSYSLDPSVEDESSSNSCHPEPSTSSSSSTASSYSSASRKRRNSTGPTSSTSSKKHHTSEMTEEDQLALAIKNSLQETQTAKGQAIVGDSSDEELVEFSDNSNSCFDATNHFSKAKITEKHEIFLGNKDDPITKLQFRLPLEENNRIQLEWPCSTKLAAIKAYIIEHYPDLVKGPYKIITAFPRKDILDLDQNITLKDANLHPNSLLHLHLDD